MTAPRTIPPRSGVGFKHAHTQAILSDPSQVGFLEIHAENFMGEGGGAIAALRAVREHLPISLHGVGLSIGAEGPLDAEHLARFKRVADLCDPGLVSEHLAWSTHEGAYYNDLLPLPYTQATLNRVVEHIDQVQRTLGRRMLLENPSNYAAFDDSAMDEITFIRAVVERTGCGLILDVNNVHVSATNLGFTSADYIAAFPLDAVGEIHLAGHAEDTDAHGATLLIDAHDREVAPSVWDLFHHTVFTMGHRVPTLIEWDNDVPDFETLAAEAARADAVAKTALNGQSGALAA